MKNPRPGNMVLICPQMGLMVSIISELLWSNGVMQKAKQKNLGIFNFTTQYPGPDLAWKA